MTAAKAEPFGLLNVLKPPGMSAHDVVSAVRRVVGTKRVGHGGTLDPAAAGVTTVAVGKATRLLGYLNDDKRYRAEVVFGFATDTVDHEGQVIAEADASGLTREALEAALVAFRGPIVQRPPMASAVHFQGRRLYELARAGIALAEDQIPTRSVVVRELTLLEFEPGARAIARLDVTCSAGTYIRSIAADVGAALGLPACLSFLLRTQAGDCGLAQAQTLEELAADGPRWLPLDGWLGHLARVELDEAGVVDIGHGRRVDGEAAGVVRLHGPDGAFVALAEPRDGRLQPLLVF